MVSIPQEVAEGDSVLLHYTGISARRCACSKSWARSFGRFDASPHSTNLGKPAFNPPRGATLARRLGLPLDPAGPRERVAIEVYPHPAMVGLWQLDLVLKYKGKHPFDARKREFGRLLDLLKGEPALRVAELPRWGELRSIAASATKRGDLNGIEDEVDGIVCARLAWLWASTDARLEVYGDVASGYIVAPAPPQHAPRPRAARVAPKQAVRFVEDSPLSGLITDEPQFALDGPSRRWPLTPAEAEALERTLTLLRASG